MEEEEKAAICRDLRQFGWRGRVIVTEDNRDAIEKAFRHLPPPWEWRAMRELVGIKDAATAARLAGHRPDRILYWENGGGTMYPALWVDYADKLTEICANERLAADQRSLREAEHRNSIRLTAETVAVQRSLGGVQISLEFWIGHSLGDASREEVTALRQSVRELAHNLRMADKALRKKLEGTGT